MEFFDLVNVRHSVRSYKDEAISGSLLKDIIKVCESAPSSRNKKPVELFCVTDKDLLCKLSEAKAMGSGMLKDAGAAIVVAGDCNKSDVWIEDCSIAMTYLHLAAANLGLGSCWVQLRNRKTKSGEDSAEYVKKLLELKENLQVLAVLSLGIQ